MGYKPLHVDGPAARPRSLTGSVLAVGAVIVCVLAICTGGSAGSAAAAAPAQVPASAAGGPTYGAASGSVARSPAVVTRAAPPAGGAGAGGAALMAALSVPVSTLTASGIPATALLAYQNAAGLERLRDPGCNLTWPLLAGIGRVESNHGRFNGAILHTDGLSTPAVIGIALDGVGTARILDTDGGKLDGDTVYDRAVGPMQFIPSTWASFGLDGNRDGVADPFNIFDAAYAAASYLCTAGGDLSTLAGASRAVLAYNDSSQYLTLVLSVAAAYAAGDPAIVAPLPGASAPGGRLPSPSVSPPPHLPPVNPGPPLGLPKPSAGDAGPHTPGSTGIWSSAPGAPSSSACDSAAVGSGSASPTATASSSSPTVTTVPAPATSPTSAAAATASSSSPAAGPTVTTVPAPATSPASPTASAQPSLSATAGAPNPNCVSAAPTSGSPAPGLSATDAPSTPAR